MTTDTYITDAKGRLVITKDPQATLDYQFDWSAYLTPITDTIAGVNFTLSGSDSASLATSSFNATSATAWVSGGQVGETIQVDCKITTSSVPARVDSRSIFIKIKDR
jgi:hypothetical protein